MVYADRLMRLLAEEALCRLPSITDDGEVETPVGTAREGRKEGRNKEWKRDRGGDGRRDTTQPKRRVVARCPIQTPDRSQSSYRLLVEVECCCD